MHVSGALFIKTQSILRSTRDFWFRAAGLPHLAAFILSNSWETRNSATSSFNGNVILGKHLSAPVRVDLLFSRSRISPPVLAMSQIPREKTSEYYDYWTSENGKHWHHQWLQRNPLKEPKISDQKSEEHKTTFFHFWWNDLSLTGMKEAMVAEGIKLGYQGYFPSICPFKDPVNLC